MIKILFVCHGNICRSPMAEFIMKELVRQAGLQERFAIASGAVSYEEQGNDIYPPAKQMLRKKGIPFSPRAARRITARDGAEFDLLIGMTARHEREIRRIIGEENAHKVSRLLDHTETPGDIEDPWYTDRYELVFAQIYAGCEALLAQLCE